MTDIPDWWEALLLALAAWRVFHLVAHDDILNRPRRYITRLSPRWMKAEDATGENYREGLANWMSCPYCMGWWVALAWWAAWQIEPHWTLVAATPFVLNAGVIGAQRILSSE